MRAAAHHGDVELVGAFDQRIADGVSWPTTSLAEWQMPVEISIMLFVISGHHAAGQRGFLHQAQHVFGIGARS